jgi:hypothetical protein
MTWTPSMRSVLLRGVDALPWALGSTLLWLGMRRDPAVSLAGGLVLTLAGLFFFASANGYALPRPGLIRVAAQGCGDPPNAFFVRRRGRGLLFHRSLECAGGGRYCVVAVPDGWTEVQPRFGPFEPPPGSRLLGLADPAELRFDFRGGTYVDRASLDAVLRDVAA